MRAKIVIGFKDGGRLLKVGEVVEPGPKAALFLFSSGYATPEDDEARAYCKEHGYAQNSNPPPAGT